MYLLICFFKYGVKVIQKRTSLADLEQLEFFQQIGINTTSNTLTNEWLYNRYHNWIELGRPENFNAENETNNKIYNEQLNKEIDEENLDKSAATSTLLQLANL